MASKKKCGSLPEEFASFVFFINELNLIPFKYIKENGMRSWGGGKWEDAHQRVQTFGCKMSKF